MLRKGIVAHDAGRFDAATSPLRVAAFGLVDSVEHYQTAHIYLALTYDRLGNAEQARDSARRVVAAERIEAKYGSLNLPADTRANFQALARRALTEADQAILGRSARNVTATTAQPQQTPPRTEQPRNTPPQTTPPTTQATQPAPVQTRPAQTETVPTQPVQQPQISSNSQTTTTTTTPPPVVNKPAEVKPAPPKPAPAATTPTTTNNTTAITTPPKPQPAPVKPPVNVASRIAAAEQALTQSRLADARAIYRELLDANNLQRADILRVAEGFYRARDFAHALRAFEKLGALRREEQPYRYYIAVALYETAQYARAKEELAAVLPFIEETPDVSRYRVKIENAIN